MRKALEILQTTTRKGYQVRLWYELNDLFGSVHDKHGLLIDGAQKIKVSFPQQSTQNPSLTTLRAICSQKVNFQIEYYSNNSCNNNSTNDISSTQPTQPQHFLIFDTYGLRGGGNGLACQSRPKQSIHDPRTKLMASSKFPLDHSNFNINLKGNLQVVLETKNQHNIFKVSDKDPKSLVIEKSLIFEQKTTTEQKRFNEQIIHVDNSPDHKHLGILTLQNDKSQLYILETQKLTQTDKYTFIAEGGYQVRGFSFFTNYLTPEERKRRGLKVEQNVTLFICFYNQLTQDVQVKQYQMQKGSTNTIKEGIEMKEQSLMDYSEDPLFQRFHSLKIGDDTYDITKVKKEKRDCKIFLKSKEEFKTEEGSRSDSRSSSRSKSQILLLNDKKVEFMNAYDNGMSSKAFGSNLQDRIQVTFQAKKSIISINPNKHQYKIQDVRGLVINGSTIISQKLKMIKEILIQTYRLPTANDKDKFFLNAFSKAIFKDIINKGNTKALANISVLRRLLESDLPSLESKYLDDAVIEASAFRIISLAKKQPGVENKFRSVLSSVSKGQLKVQVEDLIVDYLHKNKYLKKIQYMLSNGQIEMKYLYLEGFSADLKTELIIKGILYSESQSSIADPSLLYQIASKFAKKINLTFTLTDKEEISFNIPKAILDDPHELTAARLNTLSQTNMLRHSLSTIVELYNILDDPNYDQQVRSVFSSEKSKTAYKRRCLSVIDSNLDQFCEMNQSIKLTDLETLIPISLIREPSRYRRFLDYFLMGFENDKLFEPRKIKILSCLLLGALKNEQIINYFDTDDLIVCLGTIKSKLSMMSIDEDNQNLQATIDALCTVLYLMGLIQAKGVPKKTKHQFTELLTYMETPVHSKIWSSLTKKHVDPSLDIKRRYIIEALKAVKLTKLDAFNMKIGFLSEMLSNAASLSKVLAGDFASGVSALARSYSCLKSMYFTYGKKQDWYETVNLIMGLVNEPISRIRTLLFMPPEEKKLAPKGTEFIVVNHDRYITFYTVEMLTQIVKNKYLRMSSRLSAVHYIFLVGINSYDIIPVKGQYMSNVAHFDNKSDIVGYIIKCLDRLEQEVSDIDLKNHIVVNKIKLKNTLKKDVNIQKARLDHNESPDNNDFYLNSLKTQSPTIYALEKMKDISDYNLKKLKPANFIDIYGVQKNINEKIQEELINPIKALDNNSSALQKLNVLQKIVSELKRNRYGEGHQNSAQLEKEVTSVSDFIIKFLEVNSQKSKNDPLIIPEDSILQSKGKDQSKQNAFFLELASEVQNSDSSIYQTFQLNEIEVLQKITSFLIDLIHIYFSENMISMIDSFIHTAITSGDNSLGFSIDEASFILLIEGEAGTGKSLMLRELENNYFKRPRYTPKGQLILPLLVILSEIKEVDKCLEETLKRHIHDEFIIENILEKGRKVERGHSECVFLILFDGFDELRRPVNLHDLNSLDDYECVIIYTSRREFLASKDNLNYAQYFEPQHSKSKKNNKMSEYLIPDLNFLQKSHYFEGLAEDNKKKTYNQRQQQIGNRQMKENLFLDWTNPWTYSQKIESMSITEIVKTPFMLTIISQSLPELVSKGDSNNVSRARLYQVFTSEHFRKKARRIEKTNREIPKGFDLERSFKEYSEDLAIELFLHKRLSVETESSSYVKKRANVEMKNDFERFFDLKDKKAQLAREGCQLTDLDGLCKFEHRSIQSYFVSTAIYEELRNLENNPKFKDIAKKSILGKSVIVNKDTEIFNFLVDQLKEETDQSSKGQKPTILKVFNLFQKGCKAAKKAATQIVQVEEGQDQQKQEKKEEEGGVGLADQDLAEDDDTSLFTSQQLLLQNLSLIFLAFQDIMEAISKDSLLKTQWLKNLVPYNVVNHYYINRVEYLIERDPKLQQTISKTLRESFYEDQDQIYVIFPQLAKDKLDSGNEDQIESIRNRIEVAPNLIKHDWNILFQYDWLKVNENKKIIYEAINQNPYIYFSVHDAKNTKLLKDPKILNLAINQWGCVATQVPDSLTYEMKFSVLKQDGKLLKYIKHEEQDRDMVELAINQDSSAIAFAAPQYQKEFAHQVLSANCANIEYLPSDFEVSNKKLAIYLKNNGSAYAILKEEQQDDRDLMISALSEDGLMLNSIPYEYRNDRGLVMIAIENDPQAFEFAREEIRSDFEIANMVIEKDWEMIMYVNFENMERKKELTLKAIRLSKNKSE